MKETTAEVAQEDDEDDFEVVGEEKKRRGGGERGGRGGQRGARGGKVEGERPRFENRGERRFNPDTHKEAVPVTAMPAASKKEDKPKTTVPVSQEARWGEEKLF